MSIRFRRTSIGSSGVNIVSRSICSIVRRKALTICELEIGRSTLSMWMLISRLGWPHTDMSGLPRRFVGEIIAPKAATAVAAAGTHSRKQHRPDEPALAQFVTLI